LGLLLDWIRSTVKQTCAIAALTFVFGDYAAALLPLGTFGPAIYAAAAVALLTYLQLRGTPISGRTQLALTATTITAIGLVALSGFAAEPWPTVSEPVTGSGAV